MDRNSLYMLVTDAILRAETLEDLGAPGASGAHLDVSLLEERIASYIPVTDPEGAIARRGAVRAAVAGGDLGRARTLIDRFSAEPEIGEPLLSELEGLLPALGPPSTETTARALVCGAGGFIAGHLVDHLKRDGYWVRGVDLRKPQFKRSAADDYRILDLRDANACRQAVEVAGGFAEVYQLAYATEGRSFVHSSECGDMHNNALINLNMVEAASQMGVERYFFSSSVSVYPDMEVDQLEISEDDAYPAFPGSEHGWEKLYAERMAQAYGRSTGMVVRIARFGNCYGPNATSRGGRETAVTSICRKVAEMTGPSELLEVWGDGSAFSSYTYVTDIVEGLVRLTRSDLDGSVNIGSSEYVTLPELVATVVEVAGKEIEVRHVEGPVGLPSRRFSHARIKSLGWKAKSLRDGIALTYPWIEAQVQARATAQGTGR